MIVVTGSTGHVGRLVAEELAARGEPIRLVVRDPSRAPRLSGAEVVRAEYGDQASLAEALQQGDRVLDRKSTRLNSSHSRASRMPSSA